MSVRTVLVVMVAGLVALACTGCAASQGAAQTIEGGSITGATLTKEAAGEYVPFTSVEVRAAGDPIGVDLRGVVTRGELRVELRDAQGKVVWDGVFKGTAPLNTVIKPAETGRYALVLAWDGPVTASYSLTWKPGQVTAPTVTPLALLAGAGMIVVAIAAVVYAALRRLGWGYLALGALAWVLAVVLKLGWAILANNIIYEAAYSALPEVVASGLYEIYVGALTGVFEVCLVWLVLRYTRLGRVPWPRALAFGIGFGALEALLLGLGSTVNVLVGMAYPAAMAPAALESLALANNPLWGLAPIVERLALVLAHTLANVLMFYAVQKRGPRWLWLAFLYMTALDAVAAFGQLWGVTTLARVWLLEGAMALFGVVGWLGTRWVGQHYPPVAAGAAPQGGAAEGGEAASVVQPQ